MKVSIELDERLLAELAERLRPYLFGLDAEHVNVLAEEESVPPAPVAATQRLAPTSHDLGEFRTRLVALAQRGKTAEAKAILAALGGPRLQDIPVERLDELDAKLRELESNE